VSISGIYVSMFTVRRVTFTVCLSLLTSPLWLIDSLHLTSWQRRIPACNTRSCGGAELARGRGRPNEAACKISRGGEGDVTSLNMTLPVPACITGEQETPNLIGKCALRTARQFNYDIAKYLYNKLSTVAETCVAAQVTWWGFCRLITMKTDCTIWLLRKDRVMCRHAQLLLFVLCFFHFRNTTICLMPGFHHSVAVLPLPFRRSR